MPWNIDLAHSSITFSVRHMVFAKVHGRFGKWQGTIEVAQNPAQSSVAVEIDAASIDTGVDQRDGHLKSPDFLDVAKFPSITFKSTQVEAAGDKLKVHGDFTLHGVTKKVVLETEYLGAGKDPWGQQRSGYQAKLTLDRRDFGLTWNQALEAGGILVGEKVEVELNLQAVAQPTAAAS